MTHAFPSPSALLNAASTTRAARLCCALALIAWSVAGPSFAQEPVFSGPQVGEPLTPLPVRGVFDDAAGQQFDFVADAAGKPLLLVFVHDVNRLSISMTRILTGYAHTRAPDGLVTGVVWLADDPTEAENALRRIRHALTPGVPVGIAVDGREGPGSYGLNRNVMLTILVGKDNVVTANYALVQPSLQVDLPKILASLVAMVGGEVPTLDKLPGMPAAMQRTADAGADLRPLLRPLIQRDATPEQVDRAAQAIEAHLQQHPRDQAEIGRIVHTIIDAGKLANYGTPRAQEHLRKWAEQFPKPADRPAARPYAPPTAPAAQDTTPTAAPATPPREGDAR